MSRTSFSQRLIFVTAVVALSWSPVAHGDAVVDWNTIAVDTISAASPPRPGPVPFLDIAVVQAAIYDAVQAIGGKYKPYKVQVPGASGSPDAAVAKAARDVLVSIFPDKSESLDTMYRGYLVKNGLAENDPGVAVGEKAAAGIITLHASNVRVPNPLPDPFKGDTKPGMWRPTTSYQSGAPASGLAMAAPWLGAVPCFVMQNGDQFRAKPPPALTSEQYAKDYNEVKTLGAFNSTRTEQQNELAQFYTGLSLKTWQLPLREMAAKHVDKIDDSARLMALGSLAMADAVITAWDSKKQYVFWRPVTAIQEGEDDGNPATIGDPAWQPMLNTPPYPEYTSGANNVTAALTRTLALFFGKDDMPFMVTSTNPQSAQKTRTYNRFSEMVSDMVDVRIYHGVHFRFADEAAREQGTKVAEWVFSHVAAQR